MDAVTEQAQLAPLPLWRWGFIQRMKFLQHSWGSAPCAFSVDTVEPAGLVCPVGVRKGPLAFLANHIPSIHSFHL